MPGVVHRLVGVRDDPAAPAAHLVAEDPEPTGPPAADRSLGDDAALGAAAAPRGCPLDDVVAGRDARLEGGMVEIAGLATPEPGGSQ